MSDLEFLLPSRLRGVGFTLQTLKAILPAGIAPGVGDLLARAIKDLTDLSLEVEVWTREMSDKRMDRRFASSKARLTRALRPPKKRRR